MEGRLSVNKDIQVWFLVPQNGEKVVKVIVVNEGEYPLRQGRLGGSRLLLGGCALRVCQVSVNVQCLVRVRRFGKVTGGGSTCQRFVLTFQTNCRRPAVGAIT